MHSAVVITNKTWFEEGFWGFESVGVDGNGFTIWKLVVLFELVSGLSLTLIGVEVEGDESSLFLSGVDKMVP